MVEERHISYNKGQTGHLNNTGWAVEGLQLDTGNKSQMAFGIFLLRLQGNWVFIDLG